MVCSCWQKFREQEYDVDVIIVSAANDKDKIKAALRLGAFDYIINLLNLKDLIWR